MTKLYCLLFIQIVSTFIILYIVFIKKKNRKLYKDLCDKYVLCPRCGRIYDKNKKPAKTPCCGFDNYNSLDTKYSSWEQIIEQLDTQIKNKRNKKEGLI